MRMCGLGVLLFGWTFATAAEIEFNRDIRPILSDRCFLCHGPDAGTRKTKLRFDNEAGAKIALANGRHAFVDGKPEESEVYRRITSTNKTLRMPPAYAGYPALNQREVKLIGQWIEQGAKWQAHWSLMKPRRPATPAIEHREWVRNEIDAFVAARLEKEGLKPSREADRETLLRRVTLDLTGLPPTPQEVDAFLSDESEGAYEKVVDRLLASPRYAERMAVRWLEAARYADTNGYQSDGPRDMWRWRDWVIGAFERNMPFDQFTVEQLAGDLLPNPTLSQRIATGFHRNHRTTAEGGIVDEEFRVEYVADRVETTSTVWLGLTLGCTRCHDHKYDPFKQKEFYQLFAFFNNVPEKGFVYNFGNEPPFIKAPVPEEEKRLAALDEKVANARMDWVRLSGQSNPGSSRELTQAVADGRVPDVRVDSWPLDRWTRDSALGRAEREWEQRIAKQRKADWLPADGLALHKELGRKGTFPAKKDLSLGTDIAKFDHRDQLTLAARFKAESPKGAILSRVEDYFEGTGYAIYLIDSKIRFHFVFRWTDLGMRVETVKPVSLQEWQHVVVTYDGNMKAAGTRIYVNGVEQELKVLFDQHLWPIDNKAPFRIGAGGGKEYKFNGQIADVAVWRRALTSDEVGAVALNDSLARIAATPAEQRSPAQRAKLRLCFLEQHLPADAQAMKDRIRAAVKERADYWNKISTVMVMAEGAKSRPAYVLRRGAYDAHGEQVFAAVPASLPPLERGVPVNRLALARWIASRDNPLTARVTVNRFWQMLFGTGLVKTVEDFGSQGEWPMHPELLDWLAVEFMESGWSVKGILKQIVMSATYRQSSKGSPELIQRDPENRLLARGPRVRLSPEMVRDQALAASGLLVERVGGPSVKPYQPPGLWQELAGGKGYQADRGGSLYRRSLYTYWRRTIAPPSMVTFDSPTRETCVVRETRTNTPLQALNLMNDTIFVEAARKLGEAMTRDGGPEASARVRWAFRRVLGRTPNPAEQRILLTVYRDFEKRYSDDPAAAVDFTSVGEAAWDSSLDHAQVAAATAVASMLFNLDEAVTKQ